MGYFADRKSFALIFTLPIVCMIIFLCTALLVINQNDLLLAYRECNTTRAYYIADAGIADGFTWLRSNANPPSGIHSYDYDYPVSAVNDTGHYHVEVAYVSANPDLFRYYTIRSVGTYRGVSKTLLLTVDSASFTQWAYISNTEICFYPGWEGAESYWVTGNIVNGPLRVNGKLYIAGDPIFNGPVTVQDSIKYYDPPGVDNPAFNGGLFVGTSAAVLPNPDPLIQHITAVAQAGGLLIDGTDYTDPGNLRPGLYRADPGNPAVHHNTSIQFLANGTMTITNTNPNGYMIPSNMPIPASGATIYVQGGEVDVYGVVNGQVTIGCDHNIYTSGSIIYHNTSPAEPNLNSTDVLGLVSKTDVILPNDLVPNQHGVAANGDVEIDGYIVALGAADPHDGSFYLEDMGSVSGVKGKLIQYGGCMVKWSATVFGCFNGNGILQFGYLQTPYYDYRLQNNLNPPSFTAALAQGNAGQQYCDYHRVSLQEL